jgi:hypothetical protein
VPSIARSPAFSVLAILGLFGASNTWAQSPAERAEDDAVGASVNYVFATDLGSGVYDLDGRTLQIYQLTWEKALREVGPDEFGVKFELPVTFGFFDFSPTDVVSSGLPTRVDSFAVVPGFEFDYLVKEDWHLIPYARAGFSVASSSVDGWLYGAGLKLERRDDFHGWDRFTRSELALAGVNYREDVPSDQFVRLRQGFDFTRGLNWKIRDRAMELGIYAVFDVVVDPPTIPADEDKKHTIQAEFGFTLATRPRYKIWKFDAPRLGFGYRLAGTLSAWRFVIGAPF